MAGQDPLFLHASHSSHGQTASWGCSNGHFTRTRDEKMRRRWEHRSLRFVKIYWRVDFLYIKNMNICYMFLFFMIDSKHIYTNMCILHFQMFSYGFKESVSLWQFFLLWFLWILCCAFQYPFDIGKRGTNHVVRHICSVWHIFVCSGGC